MEPRVATRAQAAHEEHARSVRDQHVRDQLLERGVVLDFGADRGTRPAGRRMPAGRRCPSPGCHAMPGRPARRSAAHRARAHGRCCWVPALGPPCIQVYLPPRLAPRGVDGPRPPGARARCASPTIGMCPMPSSSASPTRTGWPRRRRHLRPAVSRRVSRRSSSWHPTARRWRRASPGPSRGPRGWSPRRRAGGGLRLRDPPPGARGLSLGRRPLRVRGVGATGSGYRPSPVRGPAADPAAQGFLHAYAGITPPNPASLALHAAMGMTPVGTFERVGFKLGAWWSVTWLGVQLVPQLPTAPAEPIPLPVLLATPDGCARSRRSSMARPARASERAHRTSTDRYQPPIDRRAVPPHDASDGARADRHARGIDHGGALHRGHRDGQGELGRPACRPRADGLPGRLVRGRGAGIHRLPGALLGQRHARPTSSPARSTSPWSWSVEHARIFERQRNALHL